MIKPYEVPETVVGGLPRALIDEHRSAKRHLEAGTLVQCDVTATSSQRESARKRA